MTERPEDGRQPEGDGRASSEPTPDQGFGGVEPPEPDHPSESAPEPGTETPARGIDSPPSAPEGYGQAPPPSSAYPSAEQGGFSPVPPPPPEQYGQPGPGYGPPPGQFGQPGPGYGPPPGQYGQPAAGYGAPPQAPGYGPPGGAYGGAAAYGGAPQATDSLSSGWERFKSNPWPYVLAQLAWGAIFLVPTLIMVLILAAAGAFTTTYDPETGTYEGSAGLFGALGFIGIALMVLVYIALGIIQMGAFASATLKAVDGGQVVVGDFFRIRNFAQLLLLALLIGLASAILAITFIGPLIVVFFGVWSIFFVVDRDQGAIDAIKSSVTFASRNAGQSIVLILLAYVLNLVGALLCGIGTLVTNPLTLLGYADFYRRVTGPAAPAGYGQTPQYG